jgi:hypothetical protein
LVNHHLKKYVSLATLIISKISHIVGSASAKNKGQSKYWASSAVDEEEKQAGFRDKKYEGFSNLKGTHEQL